MQASTQRQEEAEPTKPVRHMSAREVDGPESLSAREGPVLSRTNPIFSVDSPTDTADGAVPEDPAGP
ncbi:MAG: hypothetical protein LQ341_006704 [Variospora aurantia]|nr:MAG: hypothetical protein LQ341_006704 [Variospora aurantia]